MNISRLSIPDVILLEPEVFSDERGFFYESFTQKKFYDATGISVTFLQDNHSRSTYGVLRGLHYQLPPAASAKIVRVAQGVIYDVVVDLRKNSPSFGKWVGVELSGENYRQLWIPAGFAHGFLALSSYADVLYKTSAYYAPEFQRCIQWNDPDLAIHWPIDRNLVVTSSRDACGGKFIEAEFFV